MLLDGRQEWQEMDVHKNGGRACRSWQTVRRAASFTAGLYKASKHSGSEQ